MKHMYRAKAIRWARGWEVHIEGIGVTQSSTLATAERQARDYIISYLDLPMSAKVEVLVVPEIGRLGVKVKKAKQKKAAAATAQQLATEATREAAKELVSAGFSTADAAAVMGLTKGRISQLTH